MRALREGAIEVADGSAFLQPDDLSPRHHYLVDPTVAELEDAGEQPCLFALKNTRLRALRDKQVYLLRSVGAVRAALHSTKSEGLQQCVGKTVENPDCRPEN